MSDTEARRRIAMDTLARTEMIIASTPGASADSRFIAPPPDTTDYRNPLPPLNPSACPRHPPTSVYVDGRDSFVCARDILRTKPTARVAVLNLASDERRAGGWLDYLTRTQEEALCYSSTLYATLKEEYSPWPNLGPGSVAGIYSPAVVVFKDDLVHECMDLPPEERVVLSVITVAGPRKPELTPDGSQLARQSDLEDLRAKVRLIYRLAASKGRDAIVLGPLGCGVYACPPEQVAREMKSVLLEGEFKGWFNDICFAVYKTPTRPTHDIFKSVLDGVVV
ncbi:hypothetical protein PENSPDRAFT_633246 [Peniophora sp. CONT]|nr:hypothetical protein PENSPDRAFT_633246 [Peniophora sp. CONT]